MSDFISGFIDEYFMNPIKYPDKYAPYNIVNTIAFAVIAIIAVYLIYKLLNWCGIATDEKFYWAIIPYIFFGSIVRVLSDANILSRGVDLMGVTLYPFITPQVYVLVFAVTLTSLFFCKKFFTNWQSVFYKAGWLLAIISLLPLLPLLKNFVLFGAIFVIVAMFWAILHFSPWKATNIEKGIILAQGFDGAATFIGVQFGGYSEQHVLGNAIFSTLGGPWAFLVIKFLFALLVVYMLRKEANKAKLEEIAFVSLVLTIFGLAPGLRDALRLLAGV